MTNKLDQFSAILIGFILAATYYQMAQETFSSQDRWAYIDADGQYAVEAQFDDAEVFSEGLAAVRLNGRWGYIDSTGQWVIEPRFVRAWPFKEGRAIVVERSTMLPRYGYIDRQGVLMPTTGYHEITPFSEGYARVRGGEGFGKWGFIDTTGTEIIPLNLQEAHAFSNGLAQTFLGGKNGRWVFIDPARDIVLYPHFVDALPFSEGRAAVTFSGDYSFPGSNARTGGLWGYIDRAGKMILPPELSSAQPFSEGLAGIISSQGASGYIDTSGALALTGDFLPYAPFSEGLALVSLGSDNRGFQPGNRFGFIDSTGALRFAVNSQATSGQPAVQFNNGLVRINGAESIIDEWHYRNASGDIQIPGPFREASDFSEGLAHIRGEYPHEIGYIDTLGTYVFREEIRFSGPVTDGVFSVKLLNKFALVDTSGRFITSNFFDSTGTAQADLAAAGTQDGYTLVSDDTAPYFINATGERAFDLVFEEALPFSEGLAAVKIRRDDGYPQWGYIDTNGDWAIPAQYGEANSFSGGFAFVRNGVFSNSPQIMIDRAGQPRLTEEVTVENDFSEGRTPIEVFGRTGYVDRAGKLVILPQFDSGQRFSEGLAAVQKDSLWGVIDSTGGWVVPPQFQEILPYAEGLAGFLVQDRYGYMDRTGQVVITPKYTRVTPFSEGLALVETGDAIHQYIDPTGQVVIRPGYIEASDFSEGLAAVRSSDLWGYMSPSGDLVMPNRYEKAGDFKHGLAQVVEEGQLKYIDPRGSVVVVPQFDALQVTFLGDFQEGFARFQVAGVRWGYIDTTGQVAVAPVFEAADDFSSGRALVQQDGLQGYINASGELVVAARHKKARPFRHGLAPVIAEESR